MTRTKPQDVGGEGLDTGGEVWLDPIECPGIGTIWRDLSPFEQGYVEAMLVEADKEMSAWRHHARHPQPYGFSDLAPETLAAIRRDCSAMLERLQIAANMTGGHQAWRARRSGWEDWGTAPRKLWPPLSLSLGDDGLVYAGVSG